MNFADHLNLGECLINFDADQTRSIVPDSGIIYRCSYLREIHSLNYMLIHVPTTVQRWSRLNLAYLLTRLLISRNLYFSLPITSCAIVDFNILNKPVLENILGIAEVSIRANKASFIHRIRNLFVYCFQISTDSFHHVLQNRRNNMKSFARRSICSSCKYKKVLFTIWYSYNPMLWWTTSRNLQT